MSRLLSGLAGISAGLHILDKSIGQAFLAHQLDFLARGRIAKIDYKIFLTHLLGLIMRRDLYKTRAHVSVRSGRPSKNSTQ
jgi:hypothetical protein